MFCEKDILDQGHMVLETWGYVTRNGTKIIRSYTRAHIGHLDDTADRLFEDVLTADRKSGFCIISDYTTGEIVVTRLWQPVKGLTNLRHTWAEGGLRPSHSMDVIEWKVFETQNAIQSAAEIRQKMM